MKFRFYAIKLSGIIVLVFLAQVFFSGFTELFVLNSRVWFGEYWRFFTSMFLHGGLGHLVYNLFALIMFGSILESLIGGKKFLSVYFITGVLANLVSVNFYSSSLGASGAIFGVIGALVVVRPMLIIWAFGMPMPMFLAGILWGAGDLIGAYGFLIGNPVDNTGNIAHLSGMFFGLVMGAKYRQNVKKRVRKRKRKAKVKEKDIRKWEDFYLK